MYHEAHVDYSQQHREEYVSEAKNYSFTITAVIWCIGAASNSFLTATVVSLVPIIITHTRDNLLKYLSVCLWKESVPSVYWKNHPSLWKFCFGLAFFPESQPSFSGMCLCFCWYSQREGEKKKKKKSFLLSPVPVLTYG